MDGFILDVYQIRPQSLLRIESTEIQIWSTFGLRYAPGIVKEFVQSSANFFLRYLGEFQTETIPVQDGSSRVHFLVSKYWESQHRHSVINRFGSTQQATVGDEEFGVRMS